MALLGDGDQLRATVATSVDYLMVTATTDGLVVDDWTGYAAALLEWEAQTGRSDVADALAGYQAARRTHHAVARAGRVTRAVEADSVIRRRGELVAELGQARDWMDGRRVPPARRGEAGGLRTVLTTLKADAGNAKTAQALADIADRARPHLADVERRRTAIEQDHTAAEAALAGRAAQARQTLDEQRRARIQATAEREAAARNHRAMLRHARTQAAETLDQVVTLAKDIERLYTRTSTRAGENPLRALYAVQIPGGHQLLSYTEPRPVAADATVGQRFRRWRDGGSYGRWTSTLDPQVSFPGKDNECAALAQWGLATQAVLAPLLVQLHETEDQLRAQLERAPRRRPTIGSPGRLALTG